MASYGKRDAYINVIYSGETIALLFAEGFSFNLSLELFTRKPLTSKLYSHRVLGRKISLAFDTLYLDHFYSVNQYATQLDEYGRGVLGQWTFGDAWVYGDGSIPAIPDLQENIATLFDYLADNEKVFNVEVIDYSNGSKTLCHHTLFKNCRIESLGRNDDSVIKKNVRMVAEDHENIA
ncbi:MAG TPA: hypothetical protein PLO55_09495 [Thermotogota bacterium]|nr:hypothetical protein [Thermotogota bacterium]